MAQHKIRIRLKGYDHKQVDKSERDIVETAERSGATITTPVTVILAGPCPVVRVKTVESDGYEAVELAFEPVAERKLSKGEVGHLKKNGVDPHRHLVEFRGQSELVAGESVTVE